MGWSPERSFLVERAEAVGKAEGNILNGVMASRSRAPGVEDQIELYNLMMRQPLRSPALLDLYLREGTGMPDKPKRRERQTEPEKSDRVIVPSKSGNSDGGKGLKPATRPMRAPSARRGGSTVSTRLDRITERARRSPTEMYNNLFHLLDIEMMAVSFADLQKDRAPGVDGVTKEEYAEGLQDRLQDLVGRLHRGGYHPQPTRRRMIPKANGKLRPLGIPTIEDKLVQRAVVKILERIYEEEFHPFSFGFRPGKGCHQALKALSWNVDRERVAFVVEADIKGFFDNVDHARLLAMVRHRVSDPAMLNLIEQFLRAGVLVDGARLDVERGTPQGGVISPLLANIYLHHVLDEWFAKAVGPQCRGKAQLVRYADDFVATFELEEDARRFFADLPRRLGKFGLEVAPEKTRLLRFGRDAPRAAQELGERVPQFDFLGFRHRCGSTRRGRFKMKWSTSPEKFRSKVRTMKDWIRQHRHEPIAELWKTVNAKLSGHYAYYAVSDNWTKVRAFRTATMWILFKWLNRRGDRKSFTPETWLAYVDMRKLAAPTRLAMNLNAGAL